MADNAQKTPIARSLNLFAERKALDAIQVLGKALPCHVTAVQGQIVTVAFDVDAPFTLPSVTMPIATSVYDWLPVQVGDKGYTAPADAYLGGISGLGGGVASLTQPANLSALVFTPVSNAAWAVPGGDPNMRVVQGPDGVRIQDTTGAVLATFSKTAGISMSFGGHTLVINATGVIIDGRDFINHEHGGVTRGAGVTDGVV